MADSEHVALRWTEQGFGQGRLEVADELVAEDFVNHNAMPGQVPGREGLKAAVAMLRGAFPDLSVSGEDVIAEGTES